MKENEPIEVDWTPGVRPPERSEEPSPEWWRGSLLDPEVKREYDQEEQREVDREQSFLWFILVPGLVIGFFVIALCGGAASMKTLPVRRAFY